MQQIESKSSQFGDGSFLFAITRRERFGGMTQVSEIGQTARSVETQPQIDNNDYH